jgi:integrase
VKALRQLFKWAKRTKKASANPAAEVEYFSTGGDGWHTWTVEEVRQYQERWPIGTRARLALDLLLYTGVRRSDGVRLGPPMERERFDAEGQRSEELHFTEVKDSRSRVKRRDEGPKHRELPILPVLRETIDATVPTGLQTYLVTEYRKPFTKNGFGNKMRDWCDAAGLSHCSAHGLRKAGATFASENGANDSAADVPLRLGQHQASRDLHEARESSTACTQFYPLRRAAGERYGTKGVPPKQRISVPPRKRQVILST